MTGEIDLNEEYQTKHDTYFIRPCQVGLAKQYARMVAVTVLERLRVGEPCSGMTLFFSIKSCGVLALASGEAER